MPITYKHLKPAGSGLKNGTDKDNAYDWAAFVAAGPHVAGTVVWIWEGTYTMTANVNWSATMGTGVAPIKFIGVLATCDHSGAAVVYSDWARDPVHYPFIDCVTYTFQPGGYYVHWRNIYTQGSASYPVQFAYYTSAIENNKFDNDDGTGKYAAYFASYTVIVNNEFSNAKGYGLYVGANYCTLMHNYIHTCAQGIVIGTLNTVVENIFAGCGPYAINVSAGNVNLIARNTIYNCVLGISATTAMPCATLNNILHTCSTAGIKWTTQTDGNLHWGNHFYNCADDYDGVDETGPAQDYLKTVGDPLFTSPAGGDFSLQKTSPCRGTAQDQFLGVGATIKHGNKGAWQGFTTPNVLPTAGQVVDVAHSGPATWGEAGEVGPGVYDLPELSSVDPLDTLGGEAGTSPLIAKFIGTTQIGH